jgi:hypothetical protein
MINEESKTIYEACVQKCEEFVDTCQKLVGMCGIKSYEECGDQVGLGIRICQECIEKTQASKKLSQEHLQQCADDECKKIMNECIEACAQCIKGCQDCIVALKYGQQVLPLSYEVNAFQSWVKKADFGLTECIRKCSKCAKKCEKCLEMVVK